MFIISSASVIGGKLRCKQVMTADDRTEAIKKAQKSLAKNFGFNSWESYLECCDPEIKDEYGVYTLYDNGGTRKESYSYRIEWV